MWSGEPPEGPEVVGGPSQRTGSDRETLPEVRKWSRDPPVGPELVGGRSKKSGSGQGTLPKVR